MDSVWIVETEDDQTEYFTSEEGAQEWADKWLEYYASETGIPLTECEELGLVWIHKAGFRIRGSVG